MDHHAVTEPLSATGWLIALTAGAIAAGLTVMLGATLAAVVVLGVVTFAVFGVLLGKGGVELTDPADHSGGHH